MAHNAAALRGLHQEATCVTSTQVSWVKTRITLLSKNDFLFYCFNKLHYSQRVRFLVFFFFFLIQLFSLNNPTPYAMYACVLQNFKDRMQN